MVSDFPVCILTHKISLLIFSPCVVKEGEWLGGCLKASQGQPTINVHSEQVYYVITQIVRKKNQQKLALIEIFILVMCAFF